MCQPGWKGNDCKKGKFKVCQVAERRDHVDSSCMCQSGWNGKACKQGKVKVCEEPEKCDHVDGSCTCQPGWKGKDCKQGKVTFANLVTGQGVSVASIIM